MASSRRAVGIDLGTTHTVVAYADLDTGGAPRIFPIPALVAPTEIEARPLFPSCLYAPVAGEVTVDPWGDAPWVAGELARRRGAEVPGRLVASAKSWLCHPRVDRAAPILPWGADETDTTLPRISPVDASARTLTHVARAWNDAFPDAPLAAQEVVLTVPASFDEVARELTVLAAQRAGLSVRLLEEPQAAFYDFMARAGPSGLGALLAHAAAQGQREALVLVCDVGGGTTDLSLIRVQPGSKDAPVEVSRVAVGHHLLLGGDNMDLALAYLAEPRLLALAHLVEPRLDPGRFGQLVSACRAAKERLLDGDDGDDGDPDAAGSSSPRPTVDEVPVAVLAAGARLVGGTLSTRLRRDEVERIVLDGFFPRAPRDARPERARGGLVAFGLPYERDVAITRHVAHFFARHAEGTLGPSALLLNGGVFRARSIVARLVEAVAAWGGPPVELLPLADPDLAVARGAVAYALSMAGRGVRIRGGAARGYYVGLDAADKAGPRRAICVVPRGAEEGAAHVAEGRTLQLLVGRPVRFDLFASDEATDRPGDLVLLDDDRFEALPPVAVAFEAAPPRAALAAPAPHRKGEPRALPRDKPEEVPVALSGELTAIGTLDLACVEVGVPVEARRRFRLAFQLRGPEEDGARSSSIPVSTPAASSMKSEEPASRVARGRVDEACEAIERVFGKGRPDVAPREVKDLVRELERLLGERASWTTEVARALFDVLGPNHRARRRSPDHERVYWLLAGFAIRPGFGDALDARRVAMLAPLFAERVVFADEPRNWQQFWIAWRRIAGGLDEAAQSRLRDVLDPLLAPAAARLKKPKGWKLEAESDLLELVAALERVPAARRSELGGWILERTWTSRDPRLWAALGRIGARVPAYASVHHVITPLVAERWLDHLLREKWPTLPSAPEAAVQLARVTEDRARDVSERVRREVAARLEATGARPAWIRAVKEFVPIAEAERAALFGEGLPVGLRLVEPASA